ncbi:ABC transporter ATP-binding protein [Azospirillum griseum]|uniref:ABC transporter ATP-binding protein n=1 Tax=Azospirillum griseum TaxID=2496639 RepID=A0A431VCK6_9PROT|nr:ABC transporter ATP-binding protein [Azospirillum griseum]RTR16552.1 ABC transporter ATP-binding protein [Azospirillum griseum]
MIALEQVEVRRGTACIIQDLTLSLTPGLVHVVIGPNGTGKTTLIRALFGDLPISRGGIRIGDQALRPNSRLGRGQAWRSHFAYMPQDTHLDIALTALEVVVVGRLGRLGLHIDDETLELATQRLDAAGVLHLADRDIGTLSGGQRQMVLFAQVMMREPRVMLLDEPVSALDLRHQIRLLDLVRLETRKRDLATVVVLHDLNLACQYADRLIVMRPGASAIMGAPTDLISAALIADTYGASVEILRDGRGNPVIQPIGSLGGDPPPVPPALFSPGA